METITINEPVQAEVTLTDTEKARKLKRENPAMTAKEIAERIGRKATYVYAALRFAKDIPHPKRGRPRKAKKAEKPVINPVTIDVIKKFNASASDERIKRLEDQVKDLKTVIRYLEGRLYGTSV